MDGNARKNLVRILVILVGVALVGLGIWALRGLGDQSTAQQPEISLPPGSFTDSYEEQYAAAHEALSRHLTPAQADTWLAAAEPAISLQESPEVENPVGQIGGRPSLPEDIDWPVGETGESLNFLLQLDLAMIEAAAGDGLSHGVELPTEGLLLVFSHTDESEAGIPVSAEESAQENTRLIHVSDPAAREIVRETPADAHEYHAGDLAAEGVLTLPSFHQPEIGLDGAQLSAATDALYEVMEEIPPVHQLGGWPLEIQDDPVATHQYRNVPDEPLENWRVFLQIDYEEDRWFWHDVGMAYWLTDVTAGDALERTGFVLDHG